jgi:hypothetical protein
MGEVHAHDPVAGLEDAEIGRHVGLRARVRLDVDVLGARIQGERPVLGEPLGDVDEFAATVIALAGQSLGVLVGEPRTLGFHHRRGDVVLAGDQLDLVVLATALVDHRLPQDGVQFLDRLERETHPWRDRHGVADSFLPLGAPPATGAPERYLPTNGTAAEACRQVPAEGERGSTVAGHPDRTWREAVGTRRPGAR